MAAIRWIAAAFAGAAMGAASVAGAAERLAGPYPAVVERVVDGDTLGARVPIWLGLDLSVLVRIRGIDAPELSGRCDSEKTRARAATWALARLVTSGAVVLTAIEGDKFFGRVVADVATPSGEDVGAALIAGGHARRYDGGRREPWCGPDMTGSLPAPDAED